jgi:hypothetical protein
MNQRHQLLGMLFTFLVPFSVACSSGDDAGDDDPVAPAANPWNGKTYLLEVSERYWSEPRGAVSEFVPYVRGFLIQVNGQTIDSYQATIATLKLNAADVDPPPAPEQDLCNPTVTLNGTGNTIAGAIQMNIRHLTENLSVIANARNFSLVNVLPTDETLASSFTGTLDAREISLLFTQIDADPTPEQLCTELGKLEPPAPCQACPQDGQNWCLTLKAEHSRTFRAVETNLVIKPVTEADARAAACTGKLVP